MNIKRLWPLVLVLLLIIMATIALTPDKKPSTLSPTPATTVVNEQWIKDVALVGDPHILQTGTQYSIIWDSSNYVKTITIALEKDGQYVKNLIWNLENNGGAVWTPDQSLRPGENYQIVITDITDWNKPVSYKSKNFAIESYPCLAAG